MAQLTFYGAARTVTGSQFLLRAVGGTLLVECGLQQGEDTQHQRGNQGFPFDLGELQGVVLTHAHIDHSGLLPRLVKLGYQGPIWATAATRDLSAIMLPDSGHLHEEEVRWENQHRQKRGLPPLVPLYTAEDGRRTIPQFQVLEYHTPQDVGGGFTIQMFEAGHILGSACVEVTISENGSTRRVVFSGDLGNLNTPLLPDPDVMTSADYVLMESTYGDKVSSNMETRSERLAELVHEVVDRRGILLIPAFAVGRAQDLIYSLHQLMRAGKIPRLPIYLDSPMAVEATRLYVEHARLLDPDVVNEFPGEGPVEFKELHLCKTADESKALNEVKGPAIIIAPSGMCAGGRIRHHLVNRLEDARNSVLFVGFQAIGTLGRRIVEGAKQVDIMGKRRNVKAAIRSIREFSAHADQADLIRWYKSFQPAPKRAFIVHGEPANALALAHALEEQCGASTHVPHLLETVEL